MCKLKRRVETIVIIDIVVNVDLSEMKQVHGAQNAAPKRLMTFEEFRKAKETARKTTLPPSS